MKLSIDAHRPLALLAGLALALAGAAPAAADTIVVQQVGQAFMPANVVINEGDTVQWVWNFGMHTVTEGNDGVINGNEAFHSLLESGTPTVSVVFDAAFLAANPVANDTYDYFCEPHFGLGMAGTVQVCAPAPAVYCTSKATSIGGCVPTIAFSGVPSLAGSSGFDVSAGPVPGGNPGLFIYTTNGAAAAPISNSFGFLCIQPGGGLFRIAFQGGGGSMGACDGGYSVDFLNYALTQTLDPNLVVGAGVDIQAWYRDPPNPGTANLTNAGAFVLCP